MLLSPRSVHLLMVQQKINEIKSKYIDVQLMEWNVSIQYLQKLDLIFNVIMTLLAYLWTYKNITKQTQWKRKMVFW